MEIRTLTVRVGKEQHKKLKMQLIQDEITFQDWVADKIEEYVTEGEQEEDSRGGVQLGRFIPEMNLTISLDV